MVDAFLVDAFLAVLFFAALFFLDAVVDLDAFARLPELFFAVLFLAVLFEDVLLDESLFAAFDREVEVDDSGLTKSESVRSCL